MQVKSELFSQAAAQTEPTAPAVWGWLEPGSPLLPHIQLLGNATALGRGSGRQSIDAKCGAMTNAPFPAELSLPEGSASLSVAPSPRRAPSKLIGRWALGGDRLAFVVFLLFLYPLLVQNTQRRRLSCRPDTKPGIACRAIWSKDLTFVEIQDGRVSRLHCILHPETATTSEAAGPAVGGGEYR